MVRTPSARVARTEIRRMATRGHGAPSLVRQPPRRHNRRTRVDWARRRLRVRHRRPVWICHVCRNAASHGRTGAERHPRHRPRRIQDRLVAVSAPPRVVRVPRDAGGEVRGRQTPLVSNRPGCVGRTAPRRLHEQRIRPRPHGSQSRHRLAFWRRRTPQAPGSAFRSP